jgi:hypothetical protein
LLHFEPLGRVGGPIVLVDSDGFEVYRLAYPPQVVEESLDFSFIVPSVRRATSGTLIIVGVVEVTVPFIMTLAFETTPLLVLILDPIVSVSVADDVPEISLTLVVLMR